MAHESAARHVIGSSTSGLARQVDAVDVLVPYLGRGAHDVHLGRACIERRMDSESKLKKDFSQLAIQIPSVLFIKKESEL